MNVVLNLVGFVSVLLLYLQPALQPVLLYLQPASLEGIKPNEQTEAKAEAVFIISTSGSALGGLAF